jgi:hypothetical protein
VKLSKRNGRENYPKDTNEGDDDKKRFKWTYFICNESKHHTKNCHHHEGKKNAKAMLIRMLIKKL